MPVRPTSSVPLDLATIDALKVDAFAVFVHPDERPLQGLGGLLDWRLAGRLSQVLRDGFIVGNPAESLLVSAGDHLGGARLFLFGTGRETGRDARDSIGAASASVGRFGEAAVRTAAALRQAGVKSVAVGLPDGVPASAAVPALESAFAAAGLDAVIVGG